VHVYHSHPTIVTYCRHAFHPASRIYFVEEYWYAHVRSMSYIWRLLWYLIRNTVKSRFTSRCSNLRSIVWTSERIKIRISDVTCRYALASTEYWLRIAEQEQRSALSRSLAIDGLPVKYYHFVPLNSNTFVHVCYTCIFVREIFASCLSFADLSHSLVKL